MFLFNNWIILAILAGLTSNGFNFFNRYILKDKDDPTMYAWYLELLKFSIFAVIAIFEWKLIINIRSTLIFIGLALTETIAVYWFMKMHYYSQLSISTILSRTRLIWVAIIAYFLIGENLKYSEYIGILILFIGLSTVVAPRKIFIDKGATYANLSAFMIALNTILVKMAIPFASISVINAIMLIPAIILFPIFIKDFRKKVIVLKRTNLPLKSFAIVLNVISLYIQTVALKLGDASKVIGIYQGMLIFSVLAGIIFLKERENIGRKLIGATITIIGVLLLTIK